MTNLEKENKELASMLCDILLLIKQYSDAQEVMPYMFQEKAAHEYVVKCLSRYDGVKNEA